MANFSAIIGAAFTLLILSGAVWFSFQMFVVKHILVDPVTPGVGIILVFISESLLRYMTAEREKKEVRNAFSHYMSPALVAQLANNPQSLKLGGETKNLTMLFCDIRGFTTISEGLSAEELTSFINKFLTPMTNIILKHKGTIDKYMGDCIMAFWNAPLDDADHPVNAGNAALEMISALKELNKYQEVVAKEHNRKFIPINIGIGLNTGDACVGNMGSDQRFDYSVLGDDVNLASRLEGQSKNYGVSIVIGEKTKERAEDFANLELDMIKVKGKNKPVTIYTLLGGKALAGNAGFMELKETFNAMLSAYRGCDWSRALELIEACKKIIAVHLQGDMRVDIAGLFELYEERIADFKISPPPEAWDGVYTATEK
jgi:adenylate cyclase